MERRLLREYRYCNGYGGEDSYRGQSCTETCQCARVHRINQENLLKAQYGYTQEEWFDYEPLPKPPPIRTEVVEY